MEGTERIDYTEQSSPNSPGWKGRMWTDGTKEELSLLSAGYIGPLDHEEGVPYTGPESPSRLGTTKVIINGDLKLLLLGHHRSRTKASRAHTLVVLYLAGEGFKYPFGD